MNVFLFRKFDDDYLKEPDLTGPFILGFLLGFLLLLVNNNIFNFKRQENFILIIFIVLVFQGG